MAGSDITVQFVDFTGQKATEKFFSDTIADVEDQAGLVTALDGVSDAAITGIIVTAADTTPVGTATDGPYATAEDKAVFQFQGGGGAYYFISIPAPDEGIFLADKETVDPSDASVMAFLAAIDTNCTDPNGGPLLFVRAYRSKTRTKQG